MRREEGRVVLGGAWRGSSMPSSRVRVESEPGGGIRPCLVVVVVEDARHGAVPVGALKPAD